MEVILPYIKVNGALLRYVSIDLNRLFKCRDKIGVPDSSTYVWCIPNIYVPPDIANYSGKGKYYERLDGIVKSDTRAISHYNDIVYDAIHKVGPEKCKCNIIVGITDEEARAIEALLQYLDNRDRVECGSHEWNGESVLNKRCEDCDMYLINKYFDLNGNNYIETFRREMYRY